MILLAPHLSQLFALRDSVTDGWRRRRREKGCKEQRIQRRERE